MRSGSIIGILLELLDELQASGPLPADARIGRFYRARRYLGAGDRRLISGIAYGWLRHRPRGEARWDAWAFRAGLPPAKDLCGREGPLAPLLALARDGLLPWSYGEFLAAARQILPGPPSPWTGILERAGAPGALGPLDWPGDPAARLAAELSLPGWMAGRLIEERGEEAGRRLGALLLEEAPVDLRVNLSRTSREETKAALENEVGAGRIQQTPWSPLGLRLPGRRNLGRFLSDHPGWIEVQDEGSQLAALAADPGGAETIIDACAGAGGKTLALLDLRDARGAAGEVHACDVLSEKLEELRRRAQAMGAKGLSIHAIAEEGPLPAGLPARADLVLVDAPCTGSGTLRRSPEIKYRYGPEDLGRFAALQLSILGRFAERVRPGGRLVYTTCSLWDEENEDVVDAFLKARPDFVEIPSAWASEHLPAEARNGPRLRLDPLSTGTDGFFVSILERKVI